MGTHTDKTQNTKTESVINEIAPEHENSEPGFIVEDNRNEAVSLRALIVKADQSPQVTQLKAYHEMANNSPQAKQVTQLQVIADNYTAQQRQPIRKKENNTGLPDNLKTGIENLSGYSMDDVKVHYYSDKPAQLQAYAYAQGTDIHLGTGQEKHLPHEAWHIVQQKQGRVCPTLQLRGKVNVNDDVGLEKEADMMGGQALQMKFGGEVRESPSIILQRKDTKSESQKGVVQRYIEIGAEGLEAKNKGLAPIWMSEGNKFFRRANGERDLFAEKGEIDKASKITGHENGILNISAGGGLELSGMDYFRVVVADRDSGKGVGSGPKGSGASASLPAEDPFKLYLDILASNKKASPSQLITVTGAMHNPFPFGSYTFGAFSGIRIQLHQKLNLIDSASASSGISSAFEEAVKFLTDWQSRIAVVNSEESHKFNFLVTECGGFSKMVSPGEEGVQGEMEPGDRMMMKFKDELPGPWQNHYAAVIMTDGPDRVTLESAAAMDYWWFGMYGNRTVSQTFVAKTLLAKLDIGTARMEKGSPEAAAYVRAKLAGDKEASQVAAENLPDGFQAILDAQLKDAGESSVQRPKAVTVAPPGKELAHKAKQEWDALSAIVNNGIKKRLLVPDITALQLDKANIFIKIATDQVKKEQSEFLKAPVDQLGPLIKQIKEERTNLVPSIKAITEQFLKYEISEINTLKGKWIKTDAVKKAITVHQFRIDKTQEFLDKFSDLRWLNVEESSGSAPKVSPSTPSLSLGPDSSPTSAKSVSEDETPKSIPRSLSAPAASTSEETASKIKAPSRERASSISSPADLRVARIAQMNPGIVDFLGSLAPEWNVAAQAVEEENEMIVHAGAGIMLGQASKSKVAAPVVGEIILPRGLSFLRNNGRGARCFIYSIVMGLSGLPQRTVEGIVNEIADKAGVGEGWIASDTEVARAVIMEVERIFSTPIQVVEVQNSAEGAIISGRSHNVPAGARRPVLIRNTGAHYDAVV